MTRRIIAYTALLTIMLGTWVGCGCVSAAPIFNRPYLTWQGDPCTTMTVNYQTTAAPGAVKVWYDTASQQVEGGKYAFSAEGKSRQIPGLADDRAINSVALSGLAPGTRYYFTFGENISKNGGEYSFQTPPNDGSPIKFVIGGDMGAYPLTEHLVKQAGKQNPLFGVVGGDIAYENGNLEEVGDCDAWLRQWMDGMVAPDGRLIPMVLAIGNHEVNDKEGPDDARAPFYFGFYPQSGKSFFTRVFGPNLALVALDSGHIVTHAVQTDWLRLQLAGLSGVKYVIPVYHAPLYPSHRDFNGPLATAGRKEWLPLFDEYRLPVVFENHDHTFKRTKPLRGNAVNPEGTVYLGDGCFGVDPRKIETTDAWYLEKASSTGHFWVTEVSANGLACTAIDKDGNSFDTWSVKR